MRGPREGAGKDLRSRDRGGARGDSRRAASARRRSSARSARSCAACTRGYLVGQNILHRRRRCIPGRSDPRARPDLRLAMIDLYYWTTPNGHKITIFLEETGLPYTIKPINITQGRPVRARVPRDLAEQPHSGDRRSRAARRRPAAAAVRVRRDPALPRRQDRPLLSRATCAARCDCAQWLFWQMGGLGPMAGQNHHFALYAPEKIPYAINRYVKETGRLYRVLDKRLADREFVAGDYTIADMACYPWIRPERQGQDIDEFPHLEALARDDQGAARGRARLCAREEGQRGAGGVRRARRARSCSGRTRTRCAETGGARPSPARRPPTSASGGSEATGAVARRAAPSRPSRPWRDDAEPVVALRLDHRDLALREVRRPGDAENGLPWLAMARLVPRGDRRATGACAAPRSDPDCPGARVRRAPPCDDGRAAEHETSRLQRAAIRAREHFADRDARARAARRRSRAPRRGPRR